MEIFIKELVRHKLKHIVPPEGWIKILRTMVEISFSTRENAGYLAEIAATLEKMGRKNEADRAFSEARMIYPSVKRKNLAPKSGAHRNRSLAYS